MCGFFVFVHLTGIPDSISGKESASQCRRPRRWKFYPRSGRSPRVENGHPLQCSCLGNFMERGAWQGQGTAKSWTWLSTHSHTLFLSLSLMACGRSRSLHWTLSLFQFEFHIVLITIFEVGKCEVIYCVYFSVVLALLVTYNFMWILQSACPFQ